MSEQVDTFLAITGSNDAKIAEHFLEMSNNDIETAISLFFEHGPSVAPQLDSNPRASSTIPEAFESDADLAERLQREDYSQPSAQPQAEVPDSGGYQNDGFRAPDEAIHERLVGGDFEDTFPVSFGGVGGMFNAFLRQREEALNRAGRLHGRRRRDVFNQLDIDDEDGDVPMGNIQFDYNQSDSEDDEGRIVEYDSDDEPIHPRRETAEERLAKLFRPPFDLIEKLDLNTAKIKARNSSKWVLINIQDNSDFQCQVLNRDFWSNPSVKELVRENFVFLQYQKNSRNGQQYTQFYSFQDYPHIAILDPITGERLKMWSEVPEASQWLDEVEEFLSQFSLNKSSINPIVQHKKKIDPTTLTEEQQLEYAIKQSLGNKDDEDVDSVQVLKDEEVKDTPKELTDEEKLKQIEPIVEDEPTTGDLTRIQIRTGDGKRTIRKFRTDQRVLSIYQFIKGNFDQVKNNEFFTLSSQRDNLFNKLDETIADAGLKNASILLEVRSEDDSV